ncbi:hypothetical protein PVAP13_2KG109348 [Panicum virgatum]|uniref:Uncharacterized protein n=1 Tax=Panicum virgatum TaxID=38727 RepID=A0A8T0W3J1_PANVG|nr:hypothetical protein PVAP13_2KG109348 [Panicum virgatum]
MTQVAYSMRCICGTEAAVPRRAGPYLFLSHWRGHRPLRLLAGRSVIFLAVVFHPVRLDRTACAAALLQQARALPPLSTVRRRPAPIQACAPSFSVSAMMSRLSHRSNWRSSCHPVSAYRSRPSSAMVAEISTSPPSTAPPLPPLPRPSRLNPKP